MNDEIQFKDGESLEAWLKTRPREDSVIIAHRAAMRVAPIWFAAMAEEWARQRHLTAIPLLRLNLISGVAAKLPTPETRLATRAARAAVHAIHADALAARAARAAVHAAHAAAAEARAATDGSATLTNRAARAAVHAAHAADEVWTSTESDARSLTSNRALDEAPLWPSGNPLQEIWISSISILRDTPGGDFWIDWYQRALYGRPQNWPQLEQIALIDPKIWDEGGEVLDVAIKRIVEHYRLLDEVRRLKTELAEARDTATATVHRGHNNPPELLASYVSEFRAEADTIAEELDNAEKELEKPQPSLPMLRRIGQALLKAATAVVGYCAGLGDTVAQAAAKKLGEQAVVWVGRGTVGYVFLNSQPIQQLAEALIRFAAP